MKYSSRLILIGLALCTTTHCTTSRMPDPQLAANKYHAPKPTKKKGAFKTGGLRYQAVQETALSVGARGGLYWRGQQLNQMLTRFERQLDLVFNFNGLLLDKNVLPPVLIEGRHTLEQSSDSIIRLSDRAYAIQSQARFVTLAPTWRDYLKFNYPEPEAPDDSLLPRRAIEKTVWDKYVDEGWQAGIKQADVIFSENLGRLKRDYEGMVRYRFLLAQNMVSLPYVAEFNLGVTSGDSQMAINDRVLRITALPQFNTASNEWNTLITPDDW